MLSKYISFTLFTFLSLTLTAQVPIIDSTRIENKDSSRIMEALIVTSTYKPTGLDKCVIATRNVVIEKLAALGVQNVGDVLKFQANFKLQQDPILGAGASLQGISGENIKILIDGVPVIGRQNGSIDLSQLSLINVERIEMVEGPLSVQYGTNALAGTINIITKKSPSKGIELCANNYYESAGYFNLGAAIGWRGDNQSFMASAGRNFFSGWSDLRNRPASRFQDWKPKIQYFTDVHYNTQVAGVNLGYSCNYFNEFILNRGQPLAPYNETAFDDNYRTERMSNSLKANYTTNNKFIINGLVSYNTYKRTKNAYLRDLVNLKQVLTENDGDQDTTHFDLIATRGTISHSVNEKLAYEAGVDINVEQGSGLRIENRSKQIGDYAAFISSEWTITEGVVLRPGLRAAYNTSYNSPLIPSAHLRWKLSKNWTARASWGEGFRAPSLKELYFYFVDVNHNIQGNPNLKAERSDNFSAVLNALKHSENDGKNVFKFEISGFYNSVKNLITLAIIDSKSNAYTYINIDKFKTLGGQFLGDMTLNNFNIALGGALTRRENQLNNQSMSANTWEWRTIASYKNIGKSGVDLSLWYKYSGKQPGFVKTETGDISSTYIGGYSLADASLSRRFWKNKLNLSVGCRNLFDVRNVTAQLAGGAHSTGENSTALATGRNIFTKVEIKF